MAKMLTDFKIVFIGCVRSSQVLLEYLLKFSDAKIVGIVTRKSSTLNADFVCLEGIARKANVPCLSLDAIDEEKISNWILSKNTDVIYCMGWSSLLGNATLKSSRLGVVGYHCTALPLNRGRHPLIWSLVLGLESTASTFFFMDEGADSGDIISQEFISIDEFDDASSLYDKLINSGQEQLVEITNALANGSYKRITQDHQKASYWRKRTESDGQIDWRMSATSIHNLVRALTKPYVGAHCRYVGKSVKIWKTEVRHGFPKNIEPGKIVALENNAPTIKCGEAALRLLSHEFNPIPPLGHYL